MAHIPVKLQHALGGRSHETVYVGVAEGFKEGLTLYNPVTNRTIVRRTFKSFGDTAPLSPVYKVAVEYDTLEHNSGDSVKTFETGNNIDADSEQCSVRTRSVTRGSVTPPATTVQRNVVPNNRNHNRFAVLRDDTGDLGDNSSGKEETQSATDKDSSSKCSKTPSAVVKRGPGRPRKHFAAQCHNASLYYADSMSLKGWNAALRSEAVAAKHSAYSSVYSSVSIVDSEVDYVQARDMPRGLSQSVLVPAATVSVLPAAINTPLPRSYSEAIKGMNSKQWIAAKCKEMKSFKDMNTYHTPTIPLRDIPKELILPAKIVLDIIYNPDGTFKKFKFRMCARGDRLKQPEPDSTVLNAIRNDVNYAGCVKSESLRMILSIAAAKGYELESWDVSTAFLHPSLKPGEVVYLRRPKGLTDDDMPEVVQLDKCIYGLPQASAYFREHSDKALKSIGFKPTISDPCVYTMTRNDEFIIVCTHVDDFGAAGSSHAILQYVKSELSKVYPLTSVPGMSYFVGLHVTRNKENKTIFISQPKYLEDVLAKYNVTVPDKPITTPMNVDLNSKQYNNNNKTVETTLSAALIKLYMQKIGSVLYLAMHTRPDILYAVVSLSRHCKAPTAVHMCAVDRVLDYLACTPTLGLTLHGSEGVVLYATTDAAYACHQDLKSHTGCTLHIGRTSASVLTLTKKQSITADSSTVAEYIAAHLAAKQIMWARNFLAELGFPQQGPTVLFEDNKSTIHLINNNGNGSKTKHIDLRYNFIREQVKLNNITIEYLQTEDMTSDMLTKVTGPSTFLHLRPMLMGGTDDKKKRVKFV